VQAACRVSREIVVPSLHDHQLAAVYAPIGFLGGLPFAVSRIRVHAGRSVIVSVRDCADAFAEDVARFFFLKSGGEGRFARTYRFLLDDAAGRPAADVRSTTSDHGIVRPDHPWTSSGFLTCTPRRNARPRNQACGSPDQGRNNANIDYLDFYRREGSTMYRELRRLISFRPEGINVGANGIAGCCSRHGTTQRSSIKLKPWCREISARSKASMRLLQPAACFWRSLWIGRSRFDQFDQWNSGGLRANAETEGRRAQGWLFIVSAAISISSADRAGQD